MDDLEKRVVSGIAFTLLLVGTFTLTFNIQPVKSESSEQPVTEWSKTFGGMGDDYAASVQQTSDGGYIIGGGTNSFGAGGFDVWLIKVDSAGNVEWNKTYGDIAEDGEGFGSVRQMSDGGYIFIASFCTVVNGTCISKKMWLIRTDSLGNQLWNRTDVGYKLELTNDGGYISAGGKSGDFWLLKMDGNGNTLWEKTYDGGFDETAVDVKQTSDGGYMVAGRMFENNPPWEEDIWRVWLVKTDSNGNAEWNMTYTKYNWNGIGAVQQTLDGGYIFLGATGSASIPVDIWLVKTDSNGNIEWEKTFGGSDDDTGFSILQTREGGYIIAGSTESFGKGNGDIWVIKTDIDGNQEFARTLGGAEPDCPSEIQKTADGGYIIAGYTDSFGAGNRDAWVIKLDPSLNTGWIVDDDGPADFHTIQEAIDAAIHGDTIYVKTGTYIENLLVSKNNLTVIGENKETTVMDGNGSAVLFIGLGMQACKIILTGFTIQNGSYGIYLINAVSGSSIHDNIFAGNNFGIYFNKGNNNILYNNIFENNEYGIVLQEAENNTFYHNNFINNTYHISLNGSSHSNVWDNGYPSGGNYWSDYNGADVFSGVYQNETGSDGIGDVAYTIDANNTDRYPLMAPFSAFDAGVWNETVYHVDIISNSSLSNFNIDTSRKTVSFNVTGEENQTGFCRITIPNVIVEDLWHGNYTVLLNGEPWPYINWTDTANTYIYLNYTHSEHQIILIPQLPSGIALLGFLMLITIPLIFIKKESNRKTKS